MADTVSLAEVMRTLAAQGAAFASLVLFASGVHKLRNWRRALEAVTALTGIAKYQRAGALGMAAAEIAAAALLAPPRTRFAGALLAVAIWAVYWVLIERAVAGRRTHIDCGCSFGGTAAPLGVVHLVRNAILLLIALLLAWSASTSSYSITATQWLAACALFALYVAGDQVWALRPLRRGALS